MGEKIKTLGNLRINNSDFEVELNEPLTINCDRQIHIQNKKTRIEFDEKEFIDFSVTILLAAEKLRKQKNIK